MRETTRISFYDVAVIYNQAFTQLQFSQIHFEYTSVTTFTILPRRVAYYKK